MQMTNATLEAPGEPLEAPAEPTQAELDYTMLTQQKNGPFNWVFGIAIGTFHILAVTALFYFRWSSLLVFAIMWLFCQNIGIAVGYHRLLTHRGYAVPKWLEYFIAVCGTMALQGGPIYWVAVHRVHHQLTDKPGDPHSPRDGTYWSHMGWILRGTLHNETRVLSKYAPDLARDPFYVWLSKYNWLPLTVVGIALLIAGGSAGWSWVLWGVFLRATVGLHVTWLVNSATHLWGARRFPTRDDSRNNWWVALLTGGEGWHNNHHAHPVSARHGLAWYELDINYWVIQILGALGLARKVVVASPNGTSRTLHSK
jgi:stearoyl-CoA desaturase (delta-9 desaturase)